MGGVFLLFGGRGGDLLELGHCLLVDLCGWPWNCQGVTVVCVIWLAVVLQ